MKLWKHEKDVTHEEISSFESKQLCSYVLSSWAWPMLAVVDLVQGLVWVYPVWCHVVCKIIVFHFLVLNLSTESVAAPILFSQGECLPYHFRHHIIQSIVVCVHHSSFSLFTPSFSICRQTAESTNRFSDAMCFDASEHKFKMWAVTVWNLIMSNVRY
jgi:hypothetical protein